MKAAAAGFAALPTSKGTTLQFAHVSNTLLSLYKTQEAIQHSATNGVVGLGLDEIHNRVSISIDPANIHATVTGTPEDPVTTASDSVEQSLVQKYGSGLLEFTQGAPMTLTSSSPYNDTWNPNGWTAGDEILSQPIYGYSQYPYIGCTSGPGLHDTVTGDDLVLTAGHCDYGVIHGEVPVNCCAPQWYNVTSTSEESSSSPPYLGEGTIWSVGNPEENEPGLDYGVMPALSNDNYWSQFGSQYIKGTFYNWDQQFPQDGTTICDWGMVGGLTCASLDNINQEASGTLEPGGVTEWVTDLLEVSDQIVKGDSGGPVWEVTSNGPYVMGTNVGFDAQLGVSFMEEIGAETFVLSVWYDQEITANTVANP